MRIVYRKISAFFVGFSFAAYGAASFAAPYGDAIRPGVGYLCGLKSYTLPITVDVSSRIYIAMSTSMQNADNTNYYSLTVNAHLYNAADTTELASIYGTTSTFAPADFLKNRSVNAGAIMIGAQTATTYTATPGNYVLHFQVDSGTCVGAGLQSVGYSEFSYLLLSAALDRIFASGFAMTDSEGPALAATEAGSTPRSDVVV